MPVRDRAIGWKHKRLWLPIQQFTGLDNDGTDTISLAQGTTTMQALSGPAELTGIIMNAADEIHTLIPIPWDLDRDKPVCGRLYFGHASTDAADAPIWKVTVAFLAKQATIPEIAAGAEKTVSITSPSTSATDDSLEITDWTELGWEDYITAADVMAGITVELDNLGSTTADECELLGLELGYQIKATQPHRANSEYMADENPT